MPTLDAEGGIVIDVGTAVAPLPGEQIGQLQTKQYETLSSSDIDTLTIGTGSSPSLTIQRVVAGSTVGSWQWTMDSSNNLILDRVTGTGIYVWNEVGASVDFRMEGDTDTEVFFLDGSENRVGFSTTTPATLVDIQGALTVNGILSQDDVTDTTSTTTGSIHTDGGIGIAKALWVGTTSRLVGNVTIDAGLLAAGNDQGAIGASGTAFSDLFLASGAVINFAAGDVTITHATDKLTLGGTTVEFDFANHEMTNVDINSGAIDGTTIGAASVAAGSFSAVVGTTGTYSGILSVDDTTDSTSTTTGSIHTDGGLGVVLDTFLGADVTITDQVTIGGSIEAGSIFNIEPGVAARDILTSVGTGLHIEADSQAINATGNGETVAIGALAFFGIPTWTSVGTTFTISDAATLYVQGPPVGSTNVTHTREYALWVDAGDTRLDGDLILDGTPELFINDTTNANMTIGLTINQGANDDVILALKSSDVAHGLTSTLETDTYYQIQKANATLGGAFIRTLGEDSASLQVVWQTRTSGGQADTTKSTLGRSLIEFVAEEHDGADSATNVTADGNVFGVRALVGGAFITRFIVDEDGDTWQNGSIFVNESANANMTIGLTINQAGNEDQSFCIKNTDVGHGLTTITDIDVETDDVLTIRKAQTFGGAILQATHNDASNTPTFRFLAYGGTATAVKTTSGRSLIEFDAYEHNGANALANIAANGNVFGIRAQVGGAIVARFIVDEDGDIFTVTVVDVTGTGNAVPSTAFDEYDDAQLIRALDVARTPAALIRSQWDEHVRYNEQSLIDADILGAPIDEGGMTNVTQLQRLHNGAIWQAYVERQEMKEVIARQLGRIKKLERLLPAA